VDDQRLGGAIRSVRLRRGWRQTDLARRAGVSQSLVSLVERGHLDRLSLAVLRRLGAALDVRVDVVARWRGGELDRLLNARHSALHEEVARFLGRMPGWVMVPEASFNVYGERGVIDVLAWHSTTGSLLVIELKTEVVDVQELVGTMGRKVRLAMRVALERGWHPATVSAWVVIVASSTNKRRIQAHRSMLRAACPGDGRQMRPWLADPRDPVAVMSMWSGMNRGGTGAVLAPVKRVTRRRRRAA